MSPAAVLLSIENKIKFEAHTYLASAADVPTYPTLSATSLLTIIQSNGPKAGQKIYLIVLNLSKENENLTKETT